MLVAAIVLFALAAFLLISGAAGALERLPRNRFVGVRSPETLRDEATFQLANKVAAPTMIGAGVILAGGAAVGLAVGGWFAAGVVVFSVIAGVLVAGAGANLGIRAARTHAPQSASGCAGCTLAGTCSPTQSDGCSTDECAHPSH